MASGLRRNIHIPAVQVHWNESIFAPLSLKPRPTLLESFYV